MEIEKTLKKITNKKELNVKIASLISEFDVNLANKLLECGTYISFKQNIYTNKVMIDKANFCKARICPVCAWRKSLKEYSNMKQTINILDMQSQDMKYNYLFLTLTLKNCKSGELDKTITQLSQGFTKLLRKKKISKLVKGYFRNIEITRNNKTDSYHPHIHAILVLPNSYFKKDYLSKLEWQTLWQDVLNIDYKAQIDIQKINLSNNDNAVSELTKYTVKFNNILTDNYYKNIEIVETLHYSMLNRKLTSYGGVIKKARKLIKNTDLSQYELKEDGTAYLPQDYIKYQAIFTKQGYSLVKV